MIVVETAKYIAHLIPLLFIYKSVPVILERYETGKAFWKVSRNLYCYSSAIDYPLHFNTYVISK
jgi:hypothetical protein